MSVEDEDVASLQEEEEFDEGLEEEDISGDADHVVDDEGGHGPGVFGAYSEEQVNDQVFEELTLPAAIAEEAQGAWRAFLNASERQEVAGEAIYGALFDAAPSLQNLFKTPRAVMAMKFANGLHMMIMACSNPAQLKVTVEAYGFQHLDLEVTIPRVILFRDAIVDLIAVELGGAVSPAAMTGLRVVLNYVGGAYIYIRTKFAERLKVLTASWMIASRKGIEEKPEGEQHASMETPFLPETAASEGEGIKGKASWLSSSLKKKNHKTHSQGATESKSEVSNSVVPKNYHDMFLFNAAVMGFGSKGWMTDILNAFDPIVLNVANSQRLQEECDVLALSMSKHAGTIVLSEYKAVMLASLRSLVREWDSHHEVAWSWMWENVERMLKSVLHKPTVQQRNLQNLFQRLDDKAMQFVRTEVYIRFFAMAPAGQDYFKQSTTRLHFIVDKLVAMTMEMYQSPKTMVNDLSAMGLRHVGYGIPTDMFSPFVTSCVQSVRELTADAGELEAFSWSLNLISRILCRVITEGSTIVMKAINQNSALLLRKAVNCAPRGERAHWVLNVQVGTQSISPLMWAIQTGSLEASKAIVIDLLTIRADRDNYYFGADYLFERHPDILKRLSLDAPGLLNTFLDGFIWRSRNSIDGYRRVNYWIKHFLVDADGNFSQNIEWLANFEDPKLICHPVAGMAVDLVWNNVAFRTFLLGKTWFLFTTLIFICSQCILTHAAQDDEGEISFSGRVTMLCFRIFIYVFSMGQMLISHSRSVIRDCRKKEFMRICGVPIPEYLRKWQNQCSFLLMISLLVMLIFEPILHCLSHGGPHLLTPHCEESAVYEFTYALLSTVAILLYFILMSDFTVFSTRISAFTLVCSQLISELALFVFAIAVCSLAFACALAALRQEDPNFDNLPNALLHLWKITLRMLPHEAFDHMESESVALFVSVSFFQILTGIFFLSLFVAQLGSAYQATFIDMVGYARLNRGHIVVATMPNVPQARWNSYIASLNLDCRIEFGEGDVGLSGGIQILEPGSLNPTTEEKVRRFAGTTSREAPWPNEEIQSEEDLHTRFNHLEKMIASSMKKMSKMVKGGGAAGSRMGSSLAGSQSSSMSGSSMG